MGRRPNIRAMEDRAIPQFTRYATRAQRSLPVQCNALLAQCVEAKGGLPKVSEQSSLLCVFVSMPVLRAPRFWSTDLAATASDDRGIGEIAPRTPEDATVSKEAVGKKASLLQIAYYILVRVSNLVLVTGMAIATPRSKVRFPGKARVVIK